DKTFDDAPAEEVVCEATTSNGEPSHAAVSKDVSDHLEEEASDVTPALEDVGETMLTSARARPWSVERKLAQSESSSAGSAIAPEETGTSKFEPLRTVSEETSRGEVPGVFGSSEPSHAVHSSDKTTRHAAVATEVSDLDAEGQADSIPTKELMRGQQVLLSGSLSHSHGSGSGVPVVAQVNELDAGGMVHIRLSDQQLAWVNQKNVQPDQ
ncbi:unnamed protein product, partial [Symbiodinium pilosum]